MKQLPDKSGIGTGMQDRRCVSRQLSTAEAVDLSVDSRSNSKLEWTLGASPTVNILDFRARRPLLNPSGCLPNGKADSLSLTGSAAL